MILSLILSVALSWAAEIDYQRPYCDKLGGKLEYPKDGYRVDCLTETHAIEVDFGKKWAECLGQALVYAHATNKKPKCALIIKDSRDMTGLIKLNRFLKDRPLLEVDQIEVKND